MDERLLYVACVPNMTAGTSKGMYNIISSASWESQINIRQAWHAREEWEQNQANADNLQIQKWEMNHLGSWSDPTNCLFCSFDLDMARCNRQWIHLRWRLRRNSKARRPEITLWRCWVHHRTHVMFNRGSLDTWSLIKAVSVAASGHWKWKMLLYLTPRH